MSAGSGVFVDTSAWVALIDRRDQWHPAAAVHWRRSLESESDFLTSDYVLDETYTILRRRAHGLEMAIRLHQVLTASHRIRSAEVTAEIRHEAWELFTRYDDKLLSFTDCTSFALMHRHGLQRAFTFDSDFPSVGFVAEPARVS